MSVKCHNCGRPATHRYWDKFVWAYFCAECADESDERMKVRMHQWWIDFRGNVVAAPWLGSRAGRWAMAMALSVPARRVSYQVRSLRIVLDVRIARMAVEAGGA